MSKDDTVMALVLLGLVLFGFLGAVLILSFTGPERVCIPSYDQVVHHQSCRP